MGSTFVTVGLVSIIFALQLIGGKILRSEAPYNHAWNGLQLGGTLKSNGTVTDPLPPPFQLEYYADNVTDANQEKEEFFEIRGDIDGIPHFRVNNHPHHQKIIDPQGKENEPEGADRTAAENSRQWRNGSSELFGEERETAGDWQVESSSRLEEEAVPGNHLEFREPVPNQNVIKTESENASDFPAYDYPGRANPNLERRIDGRATLSFLEFPDSRFTTPVKPDNIPGPDQLVRFGVANSKHHSDHVQKRFSVHQGLRNLFGYRNSVLPPPLPVGPPRQTYFKKRSQDLDRPKYPYEGYQRRIDRQLSVGGSAVGTVS